MAKKESTVSGTETVLPAPHLLRVQSSSKMAFGATTAALVTLASGGTAMLVNTGTSAMVSPVGLPVGSLLPDAAAAGAAVVVDRAPGTFGQAAPEAQVDPTERALLEALTRRAPTGRRTLNVPLVTLPDVNVTAVGTGVLGVVGPGVVGVKVPVVPVALPGVPVVTPPVVTPPVSTPPVVTPPVHLPHVPSVPAVPVVVVPSVPSVPSVEPTTEAKPRHGRQHDNDENQQAGKHEGNGSHHRDEQQATSAERKAKADDASQDRRGRRGRHSR